MDEVKGMKIIQGDCLEKLKELPELCQANCSGAIIWLDSLKDRINLLRGE